MGEFWLAHLLDSWKDSLTHRKDKHKRHPSLDSIHIPTPTSGVSSPVMSPISSPTNSRPSSPVQFDVTSPPLSPTYGHHPHPHHPDSHHVHPHVVHPHSYSHSYQHTHHHDKHASLPKKIGQAVMNGFHLLHHHDKPMSKEEMEALRLLWEELETNVEVGDLKASGKRKTVTHPINFEEFIAERSSSSSSALSLMSHSPQTYEHGMTPPPLHGILATAHPRDPERPKSHISFNETVMVRRTWAKVDYERKGEVTWKLPPERILEIKGELNTFKKSEMTVHIESRGFTHYY